MDTKIFHWKLVALEPSLSSVLMTFSAQAVRDPPIVRFVGLFDTVKALVDELHDISWHDSIHHLYHAISLDENRPGFNPELFYPESDSQRSAASRNMVQAWFLGSHGDIGGGSLHDGLSLYPLQWLLTESENAGLVLGFHEQQDSAMANPIALAFPSRASSTSSTSHDFVWSFRYKGGIQVRMEDLRPVHIQKIDDPPVEKTKSFFSRSSNSQTSPKTASHAPISNVPNSFYNNRRKPFIKGSLRGFNQEG